MDHVTDEEQSDAVRKLEAERVGLSVRYRRLVWQSIVALAGTLVGCAVLACLLVIASNDRDEARSHVAQLEAMRAAEHLSGKGVVVFRRDGSVKASFPVRDGAIGDVMEAARGADYVEHKYDGDHIEMSPVHPLVQ